MTIMRNMGLSASRAARAAAVALLALGAVACNDFLSTEPKGKLTTADFFKTADQAVAATNATYSMLRDWEVHVFSWIGMTDISSDDATKGSVPADASFLLDLDNIAFDPGNIAFHDTWQGYYRGIYRANVAIDNIPNVDMDATMRARLVGENKFLRAYYYFFLVRAFGGVPLITTALKPGEFDQTRATADQVYAQIEQDLTDAIGVLPPKSGYSADDMGRATKGAAQALLAKVYLYQQNWQGALDNAQAVINSGEYSLYPDYATIFTTAGEFSSESVFEAGSVALEAGGGGSQYAQVQGVRGDPNIGWGFNNPSADLEASYEPGDPRLEATIMYAWEMLPDGTGRVVYLNASMPNNRYNQKVFTSPETPGGTGNSGVNIRIIRYADVLLMAAEAANHLGDDATARNYLNMVRERARSGRTTTLGFSVEALADVMASELGLPANGSRVFVRYVGPETDAYAAGLRSLDSERDDDNTPPAQIVNMDIIQSVGGVAVTTPQQFMQEVDSKAPGSNVALGIMRVTQDADGSVSTQTMTMSVPAMALLPNVTAGGQALLDAIWQERRSELGMEQHRWFDIVRQGRAQQLMQALTCEDRALPAGCTPITFTDANTLYPIPRDEVQSFGLQQNPGY